MFFKVLAMPLIPPHRRDAYFLISQACFAEFEQDLIRERTKAGLQAARARGRKGGRRQGMTKEAEQKAILAETYYTERKNGS